MATGFGGTVLFSDNCDTRGAAGRAAIPIGTSLATGAGRGKHCLFCGGGFESDDGAGATRFMDDND